MAAAKGTLFATVMSSIAVTVTSISRLITIVKRATSTR